MRNMDPSGRFLYGYDVDEDRVNVGYSLVRHGGTVMALFQLVEAGHDQFLEPAGRALDYLLDRVIEHDDWSAVAEPGRPARVGLAGFVVVSLVKRRAVTGDTSHDDLLRRLGRFIVSQQQPDGSVLAFWDQAAKAPRPDAYGPFATGEALWALVVLDGLFPGEGWWDAAEPTMRYLADGRREEKEGHFARLPDHWAAYALDAAGPDRLDADLVAYVGRLAGYFSLRLRIESQRTGRGINVAVRGHPGPPAGVGTAAEGLAALARLASVDERLADLLPDMVERMRCNAGLMATRQISEVEARRLPRPELAAGAWTYRGYTQVDDQQHVLSGQLGAVVSIEAAP